MPLDGGTNPGDAEFSGPKASNSRQRTKTRAVTQHRFPELLVLPGGFELISTPRGLLRGSSFVYIRRLPSGALCMQAAANARRPGTFCPVADSQPVATAQITSFRVSELEQKGQRETIADIGGRGEDRPLCRAKLILQLRSLPLHHFAILRPAITNFNTPGLCGRPRYCT